ncbi:uncharacterized protein LOC118790371 [Megalops cyprinoides]|uniref:uncharacterized protein LOC118790371 n=1 Tax=Megalops cyprinoides TaxID=118141 RepID=UPI001863E417|nr:uncharacterized protein LOC118790371 [Megalops cyprinoides]
MLNDVTFLTELASIMDVLTKAAVVEFMKLSEERSSRAGQLCLDMPWKSQSDSETPKKTPEESELRTAQLTSVMEILVKEALDKIGKLVDHGCAVLRLEMSRSHSENEELKKKLLLMENELKMRGHGGAITLESSAAGTRRTVGVQAEFMKAESVEHPLSTLISDGEVTHVEGEDTPPQSAFRNDKRTDVQVDMSESLFTKGARTEEDVSSCNLQEGMKISGKNAVGSRADAGEDRLSDQQQSEEERDPQHTPAESQQQQDPPPTREKTNSDITAENGFTHSVWERLQIQT